MSSRTSAERGADKGGSNLRAESLLQNGVNTLYRVTARLAQAFGLRQERTTEAPCLDSLILQNGFDFRVSSRPGRLIASAPEHSSLHPSERRSPVEQRRGCHGAGSEVKPGSYLPRQIGALPRCSQAVMKPPTTCSSKAPSSRGLIVQNVERNQRSACVRRRIQRWVVGKPQVLSKPYDDGVSH